MLTDWQNLGVFDYVLPFLLIFALVYGILTASKIMSGNRAVNIIVSLAVGLLALRFEFVPTFFAQVFPRLGVGLAVFLVLMIFAAVWLPKEHLKGWSIGFMILGLIIGAVVIYNSFDWLGWGGFSGGFWDQYGSLILLGILVVVVVVVLAKPWEGQGNPVTPDSFGGLNKH
jgi:hypothetical protein